MPDGSSSGCGPRGSEHRSDLRQSGSILQECSVLLYVYVEVGAVCGQTSVHVAGNFWTEVTTIEGCAKEDSGWFVLVDQFDDSLGISFGAIVCKFRPSTETTLSAP